MPIIGIMLNTPANDINDLQCYCASLIVIINNVRIFNLLLDSIGRAVTVALESIAVEAVAHIAAYIDRLGRGEAVDTCNPPASVKL